MTISINRRHSQELKTAPRNHSRFLRLTISHALAFLPDGPAVFLNVLVNVGINQSVQIKCKTQSIWYPSQPRIRIADEYVGK